jgi:hypothetical protein
MQAASIRHLHDRVSCFLRAANTHVSTELPARTEARRAQIIIQFGFFAVLRHIPYRSRSDRDSAHGRMTMAAHTSAIPAIETKLTMVNANGTQALPAYFSGSHVSLLPDDKQTVEIRDPAAEASSAHVAVRGWNVAGGPVR